jgi:hypothetical protein
MEEIAQHPEIDFLMIADRAEAINGKLYVMGGAWDTISVPDLGLPISFSVALGINIPWNATNEPHRLRLLVQDADGGGLAEFEAEFVAGRPPHLALGSLQRMLFAAGVTVLLPRPGVYAVVAFLNGREARRTIFQAAVENQPPEWPPVPTQD